MKKLGKAVNPSEPNKYDKYAVEGAAADIMRADAHKSDPVMMKHVQKHMKKKLGEMKKSFHSIQDLRDHAKEMKESAAEENGESAAQEKAEG